MHSIEFSDNDLKMIRFERFHHPDPRVARRMEILSLKAAGFRQRDISRAAQADCSSRPAESRHTCLGQRPLSAVPPGGRIGCRVAHRASVSSVVLAESECD